MVNARKAWVFQVGSSWYVGWYESDGQRKKKSFGSKKKDANEFCAVKSAELIQGICQGYRACEWSRFIDDFKTRKTVGLKPQSLDAYDIAIRNFERVMEPDKVSEITSATIDTFRAKRAAERGKKPGSTASPATINKELRALKRLLRVAKEWKLLREVPKIEFLKEPKVGITYISESDFQEMYLACVAAARPIVPNVETVDWWRSFLLFAYMTGWRVSEITKLVWEDVDLVNGYAITRAGDNKAGKECETPLHPLVIDHLEGIKSFSVEVFPWPHDEQQLWVELHKIQAKAGIKKVCRKNHPHNEACERFGFHDFRRGFATLQAANLTASQLQVCMRHQSYTTTQKYIDMAHQAKQSDIASRLTVPVLRKAGE